MVCFDINRTIQVKGLLNSLRNNGIKRIICLPVSPLINYNVLREYDFVNLKTDEFFKHHDYSGFDKIGYVDNHFVESFNKLFDILPFDSTLKNKTKPLGAIRFCPKWIDIKERDLRSLNIKRKGIKVVFFLSRPKSNVNWTEIKSVIKVLLQFPEYQILIKHHTRSEAVARKEIAENISYTDESSSALIDWAEIVLFWGTSVALEGYLKNKTMVCLSYVCGNKNLFKYYDAGYVASCRDDLYEFLEKYKKQGKAGIRYNEEGIKNLLDNDIIPGGDKVVENYLQFMLESEE